MGSVGISLHNWGPRILLTGTLVSLFIVQATGSLILYHFLIGFDDERSEFVILVSYIGLGSGGGALRFFSQLVLHLSWT